MKRIIRLTESDLTRIIRKVINEEMYSYQESPGRLKEFAESLKSHLERNGYNVIDNPDSSFDEPLKENKKNIIFSFDYDDDMLFVYYGNDNYEAKDSILRYWDSIKNELGIKGIEGLRSAHVTFVRFKEKELGWSNTPPLY
jgi:hypothetical protein